MPNWRRCAAEVPGRPAAECNSHPGHQTGAHRANLADLQDCAWAAGMCEGAGQIAQEMSKRRNQYTHNHTDMF